MGSGAGQFFENLGRWKGELLFLRNIVLDTGLKEEVKWGAPCYTSQGKNIVLLQHFRDYCIISFFKGALLNDAEKLLELPGGNTQSARTVKFRNLDEIKGKEAALRALITEAIAVERSGKKVDFKKFEDYDLPEELEKRLSQNPDLKAAFDRLTPGRKKGYILYLSESSQSKTREARIDRSIPRIMKGRGLNDCICGLTKRPPGCDGSHKNSEKKNL